MILSLSNNGNKIVILNNYSNNNNKVNIVRLELRLKKLQLEVGRILEESGSHSLPGRTRDSPDEGTM